MPLEKGGPTSQYLHRCGVFFGYALLLLSLIVAVMTVASDEALKPVDEALLQVLYFAAALVGTSALLLVAESGRRPGAAAS